MIAEPDLYWIAGLLEGEGYFGLRRKGRDLVIQLDMTDEDVVNRFLQIVGFGSLKERELPSGKTCYRVALLEQAKVEALMADLLPLMGERRQSKIRLCLSERAKTPAPKKDWTHCKSGHPLVGENLRMITEGKYTKRRCVECGKLRQRKHRAWNVSGIFQL